MVYLHALTWHFGFFSSYAGSKSLIFYKLFVNIYINLCFAVFDCGSTDIVAPDNGNINYKATILGSIAEFSCESGFTLVGNMTRTCELTGWSGNNPSCGIN